MAFSKIKHHVLEAMAQTIRDLRHAFDTACLTITPTDARHYNHAGYW